MSQKFTPAIGIQVIKPAQNLPQTATATLFTVTGGAVLVTALLGRVTTSLGATVTSLAVGDAVGGTGTVIASTVVTSKPAGTLVVPQAGANGVAAAAPFMGTAAFINFVPLAVVPFLVAGNITWTTTASDTGQMQWNLWYMPIDPDAIVS